MVLRLLLRERCKDSIDALVSYYRDQGDNLAINPDPRVLQVIDLPERYLRLVEEIQQLRDKIYFKNPSRDEGDLKRYSKLQWKLINIDRRLPFLLEPLVLIKSANPPFLEVDTAQDGEGFDFSQPQIINDSYFLKQITEVIGMENIRRLETRVPSGRPWYSEDINYCMINPNPA
jgi:hypothetical protein